MISGSEILDLQIAGIFAGIFGKYRHVLSLFLYSFPCICFWPFLKNDPKLGDLLLWPSITVFMFPESGLGRKHNIFSSLSELSSPLPHSNTHFLLYFEHINRKRQLRH